jgi:DNA-directed RNA polymerase specialized sigma24 family protein
MHTKEYLPSRNAGSPASFRVCVRYKAPRRHAIDMSEPASSSTDRDSGAHSRLLLRLDRDVGLAWEKYANIRTRLVKFFEWNHCTAAEDLADDVLDRVAAKPDSEEIRDVVHYALGVARFVCLEAHKRMQREANIEAAPGGLDSLPDSHDQFIETVERLDLQSRITCLRGCLAKLMAGERELVLQYYSAEEERQKVHRQKLAEKTGVTLGALRVRTNRLREKLEKCVKDCLESRRELVRRAS